MRWFCMLLCLALVVCGPGKSEEERCAERIGEPPPTPRTVAPDGTDDCTAAFLEPAGSTLASHTAEVLEIAAEARPGYLVEVLIGIVDARLTCFDRSQVREAYALAREPLAALVEQHGGKVLGEHSIINAITVELPAQQLPAAYCWPYVRSLEVSTPYWDAVEPPWDRNSVGTSECPIVDGACPKHCTPEIGRAFDDVQQCWLPRALITCDFRVLDTVHGPCSFNTSTETYFETTLREPEPAFRDFRACSADEYQRIANAPPCEG